MVGLPRMRTLRHDAPVAQVKRLLTRPLGRPPAPLRKVAFEQPGAGHNIVPPPELQEGKV